jgi:hypothetical protein
MTIRHVVTRHADPVFVVWLRILKQIEVGLRYVHRRVVVNRGDPKVPVSRAGDQFAVLDVPSAWVIDLLSRNAEPSCQPKPLQSDCRSAKLSTR